MIEKRNVDNGGCIVTIKCPAPGCDENLRGRMLSDHLLTDHTPEDFGMSRWEP